MRRLLCIISVCIMILSFFSGCSGSEKFGLGENDEACPVSSIALSEADAQQISDKAPIYLYFANEDNTKLKLEVRYIPMSEAKKSVNHLAEIIVNELIKGPKVAGMKATIPKEAKLKSKIKIDGDVATVDFSKDFRDKHPGGKAEERMTIFSVVNSLTELKEINKVKFKIEGKSSSEFKGNYKFSSAFPRTTSLISTKTEPAGLGSSNKDTAETKDKSEGKDDKTTDSDKDKKDDAADSKKGDKKSEAKETDADVMESEEAAVEIIEDEETAADITQDEEAATDVTEGEEWQETFGEEFEEVYIEYLD